MKAFSSEQLKLLNAKSKTGRLVEAVVFTRDQTTLVKDYFVKNTKPVIFQGNTYTPLDMIWDGLRVSNSMELPTNRVSTSNIGGVVVDFIEDNDIEINGNDILLQILYIDKFNKITLVDEMLYQVELLVAEYNKSATAHLGVNYSLNDIVPRGTIETQEFPGLRQDVIRVGT